MTDRPSRGKRVNIYLAADLVAKWDALTPTKRSAEVAKALRLLWGMRQDKLAPDADRAAGREEG